MRLHSLTTRFLLAILLSTALPFGLFGLYVHGEVRDREEQQVVAYLPRWAADAARKIAANLENAYQVGWYLTKSAELSLQRQADGVQSFEELVLSLYQVFADFELVVLADADGRVLSVTRSPGEERVELDALQPREVTGFPWFADVSKAVPVVWVDRHLSPFLHRNPERTSKDPTDYDLGLAFAVQTPEGRHGALYILLGWQQVQAVLDDATRFLRGEAGFASACTFLCDDRGRVLAHSDRSRYGEELEPLELRERARAAKGGFMIHRSTAGLRQGTGFASVMPYFRGAEDGFDWHLGVQAPTSELFAVSREFGRWLLAIVGLISLLLVASAWLSSRAVTRPILELAAATRHIAHGDLGTRVPVRGGDEIADLGRAFNTMAEDLAASRDRLRTAEREAAWAEMARQVAHEIKNPLTPMRMAAQLLLRARSEGDPRQEDLTERLVRNVLQQTDALARIAADFQQFAGSPVRDVVEVRADAVLQQIEDLVASLAEAAEAEIVFAPGAGEAVVAVDLHEIRRVFLNLVHNALQASNGRVRVDIRSRAEGGRVHFVIEDDGPGIAPDARGRLFEPYFTTKTAGTGLGLAISRKIIEAHGGEIVLESSEPGRTVFRISLATV